MNQLEKLDLIHALAHKEKRVECLSGDEWYEIIIGDDGYVHAVTNRSFKGDWEMAGMVDDVFADFEIRELVEPFKPKRWETYWCWSYWIATNEWRVTKTANNNVTIDCLCFAIGNCFSSEAECLAHPEIKEKLEAIRKELE